MPLIIDSNVTPIPLKYGAASFPNTYPVVHTLNARNCSTSAEVDMNLDVKWECPLVLTATPLMSTSLLLTPRQLWTLGYVKQLALL